LEEEKKALPVDDEEQDSDDVELERLYGLGKNHKVAAAQVSDEDSEEEEK